MYSASQTRDEKHSWEVLVTNGDTVSERGKADTYEEAYRLAVENWFYRRSFKPKPPWEYKQEMFPGAGVGVGAKKNRKITLDDI